ncbi:MAG TPA: MlaD family protein [Thermoanaerobaculia bacterium]|nr:MlaD family protein [Thermoanaerobaculia bacterium]
MTSAAKVGVVMLVALAVLGYFILRIEDINLRGAGNMREVKVVFENAAGLEDEATVRIGGVRKGHVTKIQSLPDGRALVTMTVNDDVPLHSDASAKIANLGLLGERYVEIDPGTGRAPVLAGHSVQIPGAQTASVDEITDEVAAIAKDVKAITGSLREVIGGQQGQQRLEEIVGNVSAITAEVRLLISANRSNVDATLANTRAITEHLRTEIPRLAATLDRVASQLGGTVGENREDVRQVVQNLRGLSADLRVTADNLNDITGRVRAGEGTVGKLFNSTEAYDRLTGALSSVEGGVKSLQETLGRATRIQMDLGITGDYYAGMGPSEVSGVQTSDGASRAAIGLRLVPNPENNRFYNLELADDPRGRKREKLNVETKTNPATGQSETVITEITKYDRDYVISAQAGWKLDDLSVRIGMFDSTGGVGADYQLADRIRVTGEAFDFGGKNDNNPHLRFLGEYVFRKETPRTPQLFVRTGIENPLNDTSFIFGGGIRWRDEDLKYLMGSIPLGR